MQKKVLNWAVIAVVLASLSGGLVACSKPEPSPSPSESPAGSPSP